MNPDTQAGRVLSSRSWQRMLLVDAALYISLFWRDYDAPGQMLIAHYISFVAVTDLAALFLPAARRHWFNLFRLTSSLAFLVLVVALMARGLDGPALALSLLRLVLILLRFADAAWALKLYGPGLDGLLAFPAHARNFYRGASRSERLGCVYLPLAMFAIYFPQVAYWTHYNWGVVALNDILTGMQAQSGVNFFFKLFVIETLIVTASARFYMRSVVAVLFIIQWPLMLAMFYRAPLPLIHAGVEVFGLLLVLVAFRPWREASAHQRAD